MTRLSRGEKAGRAVNIFREYLADWEFDSRWRPFVERLAELASSAQEPVRSLLGGCAVWEWPAEPQHPAGILVWTDVSCPGRHVNGHGVAALTLAGLLDQRGLRCGSINSHCPNDVDGADLTWHSAVLPREEELPGLANVFAGWLLAECRRPVPELAARRRKFELGS